MPPTSPLGGIRVHVRSDLGTQMIDPVVCRCCSAPAAEAKFLFTLSRPDLGDARYTVFRCRKCGLVSAEGPTNDKLLETIYSKFFYASGQQSVPLLAGGGLAPGAETWPVLANGLRRAQWLANQGMSGDLLDVGAGRGYFVHSASKLFNSVGIEIQEEAAQHADRIGVHLIHADLLTYDFGERLYDVVTMWDVFAGFSNPLPVLEKLMSVIRPGGHLVMTLPDASSMTARALGKHWPLMIPPGNLCFYSRKTVARLLDRRDVETYDVFYHSKSVNVRFLLHKAVRMVGLHSLSHISWPVPKSWSISLNLHDIMTVVIKKR